MESESGVSVLYIPCGSEDEARRVGLVLLERGLIACCNIYTSRSIYRWKDNIADEIEHVLFAKTTPDLASEAATVAESIHSYELPCVLVLNADWASPAYSRWVEGEVRLSKGKATS